MRTIGLSFILVAGLAFTSCNRDEHRDEPAARQLGRDAHRAADELERDAKKLEKEAKQAGKEVRQGWNEAKHDTAAPPRRPDPPRR